MSRKVALKSEEVEIPLWEVFDVRPAGQGSTG
jgi:hypothetical protein